MNTAVLIVDLQKCNYFKEFDKIIENVKKLLEWGRDNGMKIIYACDSRYPEDSIFPRLGMKKHCIRGTEDVEVVEEIAPKEGDIVIEKRMLSGFFSSELDFTLRELGIRKLIIGGVAAEACVLKTALDAFELGYDLTLVEDCIGSISQKRYDAAFTIIRFLKIRTVKLEELVG